MSTLLVALALLATGLLGAYRYWENYYLHRGFTPVALLTGARFGHREWVHFYSPALGRRADYLAYLPPGYDPGRHRYPVFYLLHGSPGRPQVYTSIASLPVRSDNLLSRHRLRPMILVFPDGRIGGSTYSDSEWANTKAGRYETYVLDVVANVDHRFATIARRQDRTIAGFSAGAYGATNVALHHLGVFANLQSWSGYFRESRTAVFADASRAALVDNSPLDYVARLKSTLAAYPLRAFLFIGRDDNSSPQQQPMAARLGAAGAQVSYALYKGGHDWQLWHAHLNQMLMLASHDMSTPLPHGPGTANTLTPGVVPLPHGLGSRHHRALGHHRRRHRRHPHHHRGHRRRRRAGRAFLQPTPSFGTAPLRAAAPNVQFVALRRAVIAAGRGPGRDRRRRHGSGPVRLIAGLLLALASAALINLGFLLQHRGLGDGAPPDLRTALRTAIRNRSWLSGQVLGWIGFAAQVIAVAIAPLALVQAFAAGGLALSVPLAAGLFGHPITRAQRASVLVMAFALALLPIGYGAAREHLAPASLGKCVAVAAVFGAAIGIRSRAAPRAVAAGIFYGIADAAIKAISVRWGGHGADALVSAWTPVAGLATFTGFLAFQSALRDDSAITAISLMNGLAALVAMACGLIGFGESLGADPTAVLVHVVAIGVVLGCVPKLAAAQAEMATARQPVPDRTVAPPRALRAEHGGSG